VTGNPAMDDMRNAGAEWEDAEVVVDGHLVSSRKPDDLPAMIEVVVRAPAPA
jgi:protease I